ncbi:MAG: isocitrate lyase/PEP mutase family protein [Thiogranum sp.]|nr:isocitrate lyase/PEP mutase family protein [Thiogranum sp.]
MHGTALRSALREREPLAFIGVYDVFSATLARRHFEGIFVSGFSFAASHHGLPDIGFIAWPDIVAFTRRLRTVLPDAYLVVDMDDGYGDPEVAAHAALSLEEAGASAVVLEDQQRPRKCGHLDGKALLDLEDYIEKLQRVLEARSDLFVIARTDASEPEDMVRRALASAGAGADAVLVDGLQNLDVIRAVRAGTDAPIAFNQIAGGRSPGRSWTELRDAGVSMVIYSTPCLFGAQAAIDRDLAALKASDGVLPEPGAGRVGLRECTTLLQENLGNRYRR